MQLTGAERYQPEKLPQLEGYVDEQVLNNTYNLEANLTLLRFYQFSPSSVKITVLSKVLLKALTQLPNPDFKICLHLVPERLQSDDTISKIISLANALETARFGDFWNLAANCRDLVSSVPGFADSVRTYVIHTMCVSFQRVPKKVLADALRLEAAALDSLIADKVKKSGWSTASSPSGELVVLPKGEYNQLVVKRTQEMIKFEQVVPVLRTTTVGF